MASTDDANSPDDEPPQRPVRLYPVRSSPQSHLNMYSYSSNDFAPQALRTKRRQVKNACTNCQKACKKCDDARPCLRCVKYGISEECVDSQRKERKKGVKRGPYKKRDGRGVSSKRPTAPVASVDPMSNRPGPSGSNVDPYYGSYTGVPADSNNHLELPAPPLYLPIGYPSGYYTTHQALHKPPESYLMCPPTQHLLPPVNPHPDSTLPEPCQAHPYYHPQMYPPVQQPQYVISPIGPNTNIPNLVGMTMMYDFKHGSFENHPNTMHNHHHHHLHHA